LEAVPRVTDSIVRNPDAMMLLTKMIEKGSTVAKRALDVSVYMIVFGRFLQLPRETLETLGLLGLLQDIGKVRLPSELLDKTTSLNLAELDLAKAHVRHSVEILSAATGLPPGLPALAALHHERYDGSGYPKGLKGAEIGLIGSIAGIVDTFDALTTPRAYAKALSPSNALTSLFKGRGSQFSAPLVEQFIQCIGVFPVGSVVELNTGEIGVVIAQNLVRRLQPRVMVVLDAAGRPMNPHKILDLMKNPMAGPEEPYRIRRTLESDRLPLDPREFFL
ncbi:MAG: HD domain-containing phosphohydrolase, partial [Pseudomonadota bacterium]